MLIPDFPKVSDPGLFHFDSTLTDKAVNQLQEIYIQQLYTYQFSCNIKHAILLDLKDAIPPELVADLQDNNGDLQRSVKTILNHMEKHYNTLKPRDITQILVDFNQPYDNSLTLAQY
mmetsp:Transcript_2347/g.4963  ORF Transcript_2347/g.4963 Transcript_2347/m.4963 type:complete len:117 (+) Transcript_2347:72-422(+)